MTQNIKIGVQADTGAAKRSMDELAGAADGVRDAVAGVGAASRAAAAHVRSVTERARQLADVKRQFPEANDADAARILGNFDDLRSSRRPGSQAARAFSDFDTFSRGFRGRYRSRPERDRASRAMNETLLQGTSLRENGTPEPSMPGGGGGRRPPDDFNRNLRKAQSVAMGFSKSMLALAGVGGVMALAGKASSLGMEEATGTDTLKRRMGDLGVDFEKLRDQARQAGQGLGVTYVESQRLATAYANEVGNLRAGEVGGMGNQLRTNLGFGRSFGVDPAVSTQFFGQMARNGVGRGEQDQRRLAFMIGDSVAKSGFGGKVEDILRVVADYTQTAARMTLTRPNVDGYANALTSLLGKGYAGMDPNAAAGIINQADSATRRGGAMGNASLNFSYAALRNASPGIRPVEAMALMEGGLFGTTNNTFGKDSPLRSYMGGNIPLNDATNLEKMMPLLKRQYGTGGYFLNVVKNHFGLSSHPQAAALAGMQDKGQLGATSGLFNEMGLDPMKMSATGFRMVGAISNANGRGDIDSKWNSVLNGEGVTPEMRASLQAAVAGARGGSDRDLQKAMVQAITKLNIAQEKTAGSEVRDSIAELTSLLTTAGGPLMSVLNPIRDAVVAIAGIISPGYADTSGMAGLSRKEINSTMPGWSPDGRRAGAPVGAAKAGFDQAIADYKRMGLQDHQIAALVATEMAESGFNPNAANKEKGLHLGIFQMEPARWNKGKAWAKKNGKDWTSASVQREYMVNQELKYGYEFEQGGRKFFTSKDLDGAMAGITGSIRPDGYRRSGGWTSANDAARRSGYANMTMDVLGARTPAGAGAGNATQTVEVKGSVDVRGPDGKVHNVPLKPVAGVGKAKPAGGRAFNAAATRAAGASVIGSD